VTSALLSPDLLIKVLQNLSIYAGASLELKSIFVTSDSKVSFNPKLFNFSRNATNFSLISSGFKSIPVAFFWNCAASVAAARFSFILSVASAPYLKPSATACVAPASSLLT